MQRPTRRGYADLESVQVHYRSAGKQTSPTLLLLHQSPSGSVMYEKMMSLLSDDFFVLAPDLPGFGQSDELSESEDISIESYARVIRQFLEVTGVSRCAVFGHHTGASVAAQLAADNAALVTAMALSGPPLLDDALRQSLPERAAEFPVTEDGAQLLSMWRRMRDKDPAASLQLSQRELLAAFDAGGNYFASYQAVAQHDFASLLPRIHCPALIFAGENDVLRAAVKPTVAALASGQEAVLTGGETTYLCDREADRVAGLLREFLSGLPKSQPALL